MKRISKERVITFIIIICVIVLTLIILSKNPPETDTEISKCIGKNSVLYTRLGCHFCKVQEDIFGENYQYLNVIDCFFDESKCGDITSTPTWIIKGKRYEGVQSFPKLKDLTGC
ncbi:MAG: hypothetical protein WC849_03655 [Candidatus Paceibacterota bacterium]